MTAPAGIEPHRSRRVQSAGTGEVEPVYAKLGAANLSFRGDPVDLQLTEVANFTYQ